MSNFIELTYKKQNNWPEYGSHLTGKYPTKNRKYIKTLAACKTYATMKDIYPGVKNPLSHEIYTLWKLGYVKKYTKSEFLVPHVIPHKHDGSCTIYYTPRRVWYKITMRGRRLLEQANY